MQCGAKICCVGQASALTILKVVAGIAGATFLIWGLLYPSSGRRGIISPRFAAVAAILVGVLLTCVVLWAYLLP
jgi:hypothetical protein